MFPALFTETKIVIPVSGSAVQDRVCPRSEKNRQVHQQLDATHDFQMNQDLCAQTMKISEFYMTNV